VSTILEPHETGIPRFIALVPEEDFDPHGDRGARWVLFCSLLASAAPSSRALAWSALLEPEDHQGERVAT